MSDARGHHDATDVAGSSARSNERGAGGDASRLIVKGGITFDTAGLPDEVHEAYINDGWQLVEQPEARDDAIFHP